MSQTPDQQTQAGASPPPTQRGFITFDTPQGRRRFGLTDQPTTIGRSSKNLVVIDDHLASRFHCVVERGDSGFQVRDLQSRNGTKVNGQFIDLAILKPGDAIEIGDTVMRFLLGSAPLNQPAAPADAGPAVPRKRTKQVTDAKPIDLDSTAGETIVAELKPLRTSADPSIIKAAAEDETTLRMLARSLPNQSFEETDIGMINARGQTVHAADPDTTGKDGTAEIVTLLRLLLLVCFRTRASDLHIEPHVDNYEVRIRVDGMMVKVMNLTNAAGQKLLSLVKVLGDIDIAQRAIVQEGHFTTVVPGRRVDYRISYTPAMQGQKLVIRVLDLANAPCYLRDLNMPGWMYAEARRIVGQDSGMILMCGPTGSGKTTTLYAMIREINVRQRNVITIEDPVEYRIEGVTQMPVNPDKGNSFAGLLRSVLRQDPDVILVGEIRDAETARIAMQAAITGHLVFSTIHAQNAIGTIFRLLDLDVDTYLVASALNLIVAQRLVRKLCPHCKVPRKPSPTELMRLNRAVTDVPIVQQAVGCNKCLETGYHNRTAIYETLLTTEELRDVILSSGTIQHIRKAIANTMFSSLLDSGYKLVAEGVTPIEEVERVVGMD